MIFKVIERTKRLFVCCFWIILVLGFIGEINMVLL